VSLTRYADHAARWAVIALGFSIPISVALDNTLLVLILAGWLAGGMYREKLLVIRGNPVAIAALVLFGLLLIGVTYSRGAIGEAMHYLGKYSDLLFIPIFLFLFRDSATRHRALYSLAGSLAVVLALSYLLKTGVMPENALMIGDSGYPVVFKLHLTHNILIAYAAFLYAWLAFSSQSAKARWGWVALSVLAVVNVTLMVHGATGYLVLFTLALVLGFDRGHWRGLGIAVLGLAALVIALSIIPGPFQERASLIFKEARGWEPDRPADTSSGFRLEFYRNTLDIIADHPIIGVGTGGLPQAYADKIRGSGKAETRNPHNEFLHITAQIGVIGLAVLLALFYLQWRHAARLLCPLHGGLARGLVLTMVIGCMLNSLLLDHTEGLLYAWLTGLLYAGLKSDGVGSGK